MKRTNTLNYENSRTPYDYKNASKKATGNVRFFKILKEKYTMNRIHSWFILALIWIK